MCRRRLCVITVIMMIFSCLRAGVFLKCELLKRYFFGNSSYLMETESEHHMQRYVTLRYVTRSKGHEYQFLLVLRIHNGRTLK